MNQPALYSKSNGIQKNDAEFVVENFLRLVKWKKQENILDIGSGDGSVSLEILLPKFPADFCKFLGSDVSDEMLRMAKSRSKDSRIDFISLDISTREVNTDLHEFFDHIFSFYCLHWVPDQRQAIGNIYEMLKPGGEVLLTFLAKHPIFDIYEAMAKSNKWAPHMTNVKKFIGPYHHSEDPELELRTLLKKQGFTSHVCRMEKRIYTFPSMSILIKSIRAVNPFIKNLNKSQIQDYTDDYLKEVQKLDSVKIENGDNNNDEAKIHVSYHLFIVFASKPL